MAEPTPPAGSLLPLPAGIWRLVGEHPWTPAEVGRGLRRICVAAGTLAAGASGPAAAEALQADGAGGTGTAGREIATDALGRWLIERRQRLLAARAGGGEVGEELHPAGTLVVRLQTRRLAGAPAELALLARLLARERSDGATPAFALHLEGACPPAHPDPGLGRMLAAAQVASVTWGEPGPAARRAELDQLLAEAGVASGHRLLLTRPTDDPAALEARLAAVRRAGLAALRWQPALRLEPGSPALAALARRRPELLAVGPPGPDEDADALREQGLLVTPAEPCFAVPRRLKLHGRQLAGLPWLEALLEREELAPSVPERAPGALVAGEGRSGATLGALLGRLVAEVLADDAPGAAAGTTAGAAPGVPAVLPPGEASELAHPRALARLWRHEAAAELETALRQALLACRLAPGDGRSMFELARLLLQQRVPPCRLAPLGRLPGMAMDLGWVARQLAGHALATGRPAEAAALLGWLLEELAPAALHGVGSPSSGEAELLRLLARARQLAGDAEGVQAAARRLLTAPSTPDRPRRAAAARLRPGRPLPLRGGDARHLPWLPSPLRLLRRNGVLGPPPYRPPPARRARRAGAARRAIRRPSRPHRGRFLPPPTTQGGGFCREVARRLPGLSWGCLGRAEAVDEPLLERLQAAVAVAVAAPLEAGGSARVLHHADEHGHGAVRRTRKAVVADPGVGFETYSFGQKRKPSPWATARECGSLRAFSSLLARRGDG